MKFRSIFLGIVFAAGTASAVSAQDAGAVDPAKADEGEGIYGNYCQTCHGDNLVTSGQTFDLRRLKPEDRKRFETSVQNGKGQMPPWRGIIDADQMEKVWHYIMSRRS